MTIDEIFELIGSNICNCIKTDSWEKAVLNIQGGDNEIGFDGFYIVNNNKYDLAVQNFDMDVDFALMDLHKITTEGGSNEWNYAVFTLLPTGEFNIDFCMKDGLNEND